MQYHALMDGGAAALARAIGTRVKRERQARRWTLDQLAAAAGVSRRMVVNVEQGAVNPSVGTLLRLSDALGLGLPALVEQPRRAALEVTRHGTGAVLWRGETAGVECSWPPPSSRTSSSCGTGRWGPVTCHPSEAHAPGTKELLQVHAGSVRVDVADQAVVLGPGDAVAFPGDVAHGTATRGRSRPGSACPCPSRAAGLPLRRGAPTEVSMTDTSVLDEFSPGRSSPPMFSR